MNKDGVLLIGCNQMIKEINEDTGLKQFNALIYLHTGNLYNTICIMIGLLSNCVFRDQARVARFGLFEAKKQIWPFLKISWP